MTASPQRAAARRKTRKGAAPAAARHGEGTGTQVVSPELAKVVIQGHAAHRSGDLDGAARLYEQALAIRPDLADALHLLGVVHLQRGNSGKAVEFIEAAIAADPAPPQFYSNYGAALHPDRKSTRLNSS